MSFFMGTVEAEIDVWSDFPAAKITWINRIM
jgi:hypothetical protein